MSDLHNFSAFGAALSRLTRDALIHRKAELVALGMDVQRHAVEWWEVIGTARGQLDPLGADEHDEFDRAGVVCYLSCLSRAASLAAQNARFLKEIRAIDAVLTGAKQLPFVWSAA